MLNYINNKATWENLIFLELWMSFYICIVISRTGLVGGKVVYIFTVFVFPFYPAQVWWGSGCCLYIYTVLFSRFPRTGVVGIWCCPISSRPHVYPPTFIITQTFMAADRLPRKHREIQEGKFCSNTYPSGIQAYNKQRLKVWCKNCGHNFQRQKGRPDKDIQHTLFYQ